MPAVLTAGRRLANRRALHPRGQLRRHRRRGGGRRLRGRRGRGALDRLLAGFSAAGFSAAACAGLVAGGRAARGFGAAAGAAGAGALVAEAFATGGAALGAGAFAAGSGDRFTAGVAEHDLQVVAGGLEPERDRAGQVEHDARDERLGAVGRDANPLDWPLVDGGGGGNAVVTPLKSSTRRYGFSRVSSLEVGASGPFPFSVTSTGPAARRC